MPFRFMLLPVLVTTLVCAQVPPVTSAPDTANPRQLFRKGKFRAAADSFQKMIDAQPAPEAYAGLVQSLLKLNDVASADTSSRKGLEAFPQSAATHAARADVYFRRGLFPDSENEYKAARKLDEKCARAWLGQGKLDAVMAQRVRAKEEVFRAHELDPDDGDALYEWAIRQPYPNNVAGLEKHLAEFRSDPDEEQHERDYVELLKALAGRKVWVLSPDVERAQLKLELMTMGSGLAPRGYGLRVSFNDRASATLLLDTGSSGVTITKKFAEKIGARKLADMTLEGVGKGHLARGYQAWVDKIAVGDLHFHDCYIHVTPAPVADTDGTIGTDVFVKFLVALDFPRRKLRLEPLPPWSAGADPPAEEKAFTQAFGFGHLLLMTTQVGKKASGLFVIDSGANANTISLQLARQVNDMHLANLPVLGAGGIANSTFMADDVTLQVSHVRRTGERILTVDLHSISKYLGTEVSGQIGFNMLDRMIVIINYRDGLVDFTYKP